MKKPLGPARLLLKYKPKRYNTIIMMLVIWTGVVGSLFAGISQDLHNKDFIKGRLVTIADTLPVNEIADLQGDRSDLNSSSYRQLNQRLQQLQRDNSDLKFIDVMGSHNGTVFSYANSQPPGTAGYAAPGDSYPEASLRLRNAFTGSEPFLEGPTRSRGSFWITARAPVIEHTSGRIVAVVSVDVPAIKYYQHVAFYAAIPLLLALVPLLALFHYRKLEAKQTEVTALRNQFVSIASHELRSPLAGMIWAIQSLQKSDDNMTDHQKDLLNDMFRSTASSMSTVNEILDLSIFERGQAQKLQHEQVDLSTVIKEVIATLKLGAAEYEITLSKVGEWPDQAMVIGDVAALKRAYMNLVSNAIKYSHNKDNVEIGYRHDGREHIISVRDHGIGIPEAEQEKVLSGYYRATNAGQKQAHGTGLGLWLARMMAEQHGGRLWLTSKENEGTTVFFALPDSTLATAAPQPATTEAPKTT